MIFSAVPRNQSVRRRRRAGRFHNSLGELMRGFYPLLVAGVALISAACSNDSVAPTRSVAFQKTAASVSRMESVSSDVKTKTATFTISPNGGRVKAGDFFVDFPANAVCDPTTSGYGPDTWDTPCATLATPITITATYWW